MKGNGNVQSDEPAEQVQFTEGDVVALTQQALRTSRLSTMSPRMLHGIGWPNFFVVLHTFETEGDGPCVTLFPCCLTLVDRRTNKHRCTGHPATFFEKVDQTRVPRKGDRQSAVHVPFFGKIVDVAYEDDPDNPQIKTQAGPFEFLFTGGFAKLLKSAFDRSEFGG